MAASSNTVAIQPSGSIQRCSAASARGPPRRMAPATRYTRLPRPTNMLAMNGSSGTPTMPEAQVKNYSGIGVNPASTRIQNAFHGESMAMPRR